MFIFSTELLARQLRSAAEDNKSGIGIKIYRNAEKIPFLTFADDTMIFAKATKTIYAIIKNTIQEYCNMSGQLVNYHKSAYQYSKKIDRIKDEEFKSTLEMNYVTTLDKYLGCPIINNRVTNTTFQNVVERTSNNLSEWKANSLSKVGRVTLIKSTLASTPLYSMQSFMLSKANLEELDRTNRNFFWNKDHNTK